MELRPYQKEAVQAISNHWREWDKELLVLPTGCGKTICFNQVALDRSKQGQVLILAHRDELIEQAREKFPGITGKIKAVENDIKPVTVGSVQTMSRRKYDAGLFHTIIIDEAHHATSDSYQALLNQFPAAKVLGVTATPSRADKKQLGNYFEGIAYEYPLRRAVQEGYLCNLTAQTIPLTIDLSGVKVRVGDFEVNSVAEALEPYLPEIAKAIAQYAGDRKTVVFLPLVSIAQEFCRILNENGIESREVNGSSPDRKETLQWFNAAGKGTALCNAMLLTEGWDCPSVDCVVVLRPTKITALYQQMIGRGTRLYPGKKDLLILDFLYLCTRHNLCRPASLVTGNEEDIDHVVKKAGEEQIDLFNAVSDAEESRRNKLAEELKRQASKKARTIDPLAYFMDIGDMDLEDYSPDFRWQREALTEAQKKVLDRYSIKTDGLTKGEGAIIINKLYARRAQGLCTPKQMQLLLRLGYQDAASMTKGQAGAIIGKLQKEGWQKWRV